MSRPSLNFPHLAFFTLLFGAIGDWVSTKIGIALGFTEGNRLVALLMRKGVWIQTDIFIIGICFATPFLLNRYVNGAPKTMYLFPILAGILKLGVFVWNLSVIF